MHKQNWYGRCIKILTETDNLYVFNDVYSDTHCSCQKYLVWLWFMNMLRV